VTASIGITSFAGSAEDRTDGILADADRALAEAKVNGRDRYFLAGEHREPTAYDTRLGWEARIRRALATDGFTLYMQPIIALNSRRTVMHEVLLRMEGERGLISPGAFLGVAEQQGLIHEIDRWVVGRALDLLEADPRLVLAVNVSSRSLDDAQLMEVIRRRLLTGRIKVDNFVIEVTETAAVVDIDRAHGFAQVLGALGCGLALDDFGTGFGSLSHLKSIPAGYLKIDGDFVRGPRSRTDECVIEAIVSLAHGLGKKTIAEFVEDEATLDELDRVGVDFAQGFHVGRPGPIDDFLHRTPAG
jgi:EAL domain-containing protein (putative c-di-GMP-specific phosphodiesterase class I)